MKVSRAFGFQEASRLGLLGLKVPRWPVLCALAWPPTSGSRTPPWSPEGLCFSRRGSDNAQAKSLPMSASDCQRLSELERRKHTWTREKACGTCSHYLSCVLRVSCCPLGPLRGFSIIFWLCFSLTFFFPSSTCGFQGFLKLHFMVSSLSQVGSLKALQMQDC